MRRGNCEEQREMTSTLCGVEGEEKEEREDKVVARE